MNRREKSVEPGAELPLAVADTHVQAPGRDHDAAGPEEGPVRGFAHIERNGPVEALRVGRGEASRHVQGDADRHRDLRPEIDEHPFDGAGAPGGCPGGEVATAGRPLW